MKLIRKGKVKEVYEIDNFRLLFKFTDNISVFDKIIPTKIPGKGRILCLSSAYWFKKIGKIGIKNHFIECKDSEMIVRRFKIVDNPSKREKNYLIPLEFITRYYLAGSLYDRVKSGKINYKNLGFKNMPKYGERLPEPYFEITTKFEKFDRKVGFEEAKKIGGLEDDEIEEIRKIILKIDEIIQEDVKRRNLIHVDGKKEFALGENREIYVVDTFGTMDEDRWWDMKKYKEGEIEELSKEFVRQYYRKTGYYEKLMEARKNSQQDPEIPPLPDDIVKKVKKLYEDMYGKITGNSEFRL